MDIPSSKPRPNHPAWCRNHHAGNPLVHERVVGPDLELSAQLAFGLCLQHVEGDTVTNVLFMQKTPREVALTRLSIVEAAILRDKLTEALALLGR